MVGNRFPSSEVLHLRIILFIYANLNLTQKIVSFGLKKHVSFLHQHDVDEE